MIGALRRIVAAARLGVDEVFSELDRAARAASAGLEAASAWRVEGDRYACVYASGARYQGYRGVTVPALEPTSPLGAAQRSGLPAAVEKPLIALHPGDRHALAVPLCADVPLVWYLAFAGPLPPAAVRTLLDCCELAGAALQLAYDRLDDRARATFDGLTGLLSPRAFRSELAQRLRRAQRVSCVPRAALVFVDTDRFKDWNDRYGHSAGDELLRRLAAILRAHAPGPDDLVARNGGDEFCLVWADCEKSRAIARAEELRRAIAAAFASDPIPITASIGVAAFPRDAATPEGLLEAADAAMYAAKRAGRNRVSQSGAPGAPPGFAKSGGWR